MPDRTTAEHARLGEAIGAAEADLFAANPWYEWGPYLSERAWGTVREDYSADGDAWTSFPHDHARSRAYRWNEDGMAGISDVRHELCLALALWNGRDPILKERMFGLTGPEGNHGEDVKEYWWYLEGLPSHALLKWRYHYPQAEFPYDQLVHHGRGLQDPELELLDTGVFDDDRYWAVDVTYAKATPTDIDMRVTITNHGPDTETLQVLPTLWFRNTWTWAGGQRPRIAWVDDGLQVSDHALAGYRLECAPGPDGVAPEPLFCENETNDARLYGGENTAAYPKDGINDHVVSGSATVNPDLVGSKAALRYQVTVPAGETVELRLRLHARGAARKKWAGKSFDKLMAAREADADEFYSAIAPADTPPEKMRILRQASAGLVWSKQMYPYDVGRWLDGDPAMPTPPPQRLTGRNHNWRNLDAFDVLAMPDPWEYPWFAAWDLGFHTVAWAHLDPAFAKYQLLVLLREWFQHPNGALPAYEWNFDDVNPPVHVMAALRVYRIDGSRDREFLERVFQKLLVNFTWWLNRQDADGNNVFSGGFLGLDNISPLDRSNLPPGVKLEQADGTAWMAYYALSMLVIAIALAEENPVYEDMVIKFLEHFLQISQALSAIRGSTTPTTCSSTTAWNCPPDRPSRSRCARSPVSSRSCRGAAAGGGRVRIRRAAASHPTHPAEVAGPRGQSRRARTPDGRPAERCWCPRWIPTPCRRPCGSSSTRPPSCRPMVCGRCPSAMKADRSRWRASPAPASTTNRQSPARACSGATRTGAAPSGCR